VMNSTVSTNVTDAVRRNIDKLGFISKRQENAFAQSWARKLEVKTAALDSTAATLSGGNQQKVVLAKWLASQPKVLLIDEPTRGIDVGTKAEVHRLLSELAARGVAVLMISSELPEVLGMADRIVVLFEGSVAREFTRAEADEHAIMRAATGVVEEAA
jgi:rhamnose transport system ATP-binding protein